MRSCLGYAESELPVGPLTGDVQHASRNMGVEPGRENASGISF